MIAAIIAALGIAVMVVLAATALISPASLAEANKETNPHHHTK